MAEDRCGACGKEPAGCKCSEGRLKGGRLSTVDKARIRELAAGGWSAKQIAGDLGRQVRTVRAELEVQAAQQGIEKGRARAQERTAPADLFDRARALTQLLGELIAHEGPDAAKEIKQLAWSTAERKAGL